jgi:hypothetical protein
MLTKKRRGSIIRTVTANSTTAYGISNKKKKNGGLGGSIIGCSAHAELHGDV